MYLLGTPELRCICQHVVIVAAAMQQCLKQCACQPNFNVSSGWWRFVRFSRLKLLVRAYLLPPVLSPRQLAIQLSSGWLRGVATVVKAECAGQGVTIAIGPCVLLRCPSPSPSSGMYVKTQARQMVSLFVFQKLPCAAINATLYRSR